MRKLICICFALLGLLQTVSCASQSLPEETGLETSAAVTLLTQAPDATTGIAEETDFSETVETSVTTESTEAVTMAQTSAESAEAVTMAQTSAESTEATAATQKPAVSTTDVPAITDFVPSVLEGEYAMGGEPLIEERDGFTYVNGILIVSKSYAIPENYDPAGIAPEAQTAFDAMKAAAQEDGIKLKIISGYRPYRQQDSTYHNYAARDGKEAADRYSARPGHSEHQTGLAMDLNSLSSGFGDTEAGKWIAAHCAEYGFILRYPQGKEEETGYMYEPWHIRYLNVELAKAITESGLSLEEYLGIQSVYAEE